MAAIGLDTLLANQKATDAATANKAKDKIASQKNMFLNLLVKQLQYQDPLDPVKNTEFTAQLAQFSQLESLSDMKESMDKVSQLQASVNNIQALSFIGRNVDAKGNTVQYSGQAVDLNIDLEDSAAQVKVTIFESDGTPVRTLTTKNAKKGAIVCNWDGKGDNGQSMASGKYYFTSEATGPDGNRVGSTTYARGLVTGVRYDSGNIVLQIGNKEVSLADVKTISN